MDLLPYLTSWAFLRDSFEVTYWMIALPLQSAQVGRIVWHVGALLSEAVSIIAEIVGILYSRAKRAYLAYRAFNQAFTRALKLQGEHLDEQAKSRSLAHGTLLADLQRIEHRNRVRASFEVAQNVDIDLWLREHIMRGAIRKIFDHQLGIDLVKDCPRNELFLRVVAEMEPYLLERQQAGGIAVLNYAETGMLYGR